jgi:hypothetical protein
MINTFKKYWNKLTNKPVSLGLFVSFDNTEVSKKQVAKVKARPVSSYSAKYKVSPDVNYGFELVAIRRSMYNEPSRYELRCIETSEIIVVDNIAFLMLFKKIKGKHE